MYVRDEEKVDKLFHLWEDTTTVVVDVRLQYREGAD